MSDQENEGADYPQQPFAPQQYEGYGAPPQQQMYYQPQPAYRVFDPELVNLPEPLRSDLQTLIDERVEGIVQHTIAPYREEVLKQVSQESERSEQKILQKVQEWAKKSKDTPQQQADTISASSYPQYAAQVPQAKGPKSRNGSVRKSDNTTVDHLVGLAPAKFNAPVQAQIPLYEDIEVQKQNEHLLKDYSEDVYAHLDPISVSLQERVKFGGHVTSILEDRPQVDEQIDELVEVGLQVRVSKTALMAAEIERQENRNRKPKMQFISGTKNYDTSQQFVEFRRVQEENERRKRDFNTIKDKYYDPEAYSPYEPIHNPGWTPLLSVKQVAVPVPFTDQKPGTSGLRKKVKVFKQQHYLESFVQSIFNSLPSKEYKGRALVVSGDGRYHNDVATQTIIQIAVSNGVRQVFVGQHCLLSTPAVSAMVRRLNEDNGPDYCFGGIVLSASHNPGGPDEDFGIKFNGKNGGPAPESITEEIFAQTKKLTHYTLLEGYSSVDTDTCGHYFLPKLLKSPHQSLVSVIDNSAQYNYLMSQLFDFEQIRNLMARKDFSMTFDGMHGVAGPYAQKIFGQIFGVNDLMRCEVLEDFGGAHPDPNLTYAPELVSKMGIFKENKNAPDFGAACDGDADRNMVLGNGFFVTPSDSVAVIVANHRDIPYLSQGISGAARSMPTSGALDMVTKKLGIDLYETPTGWKFFGNLLDSGRIHVCGEESFGTGSSHVREKDGIWAVLCWLQILAVKNQDPYKPLVSVEDIVKDHWKTFGRNYYRRYDYENLTTEAAAKVFSRIESQFGVFEQESNGNTSTNFSYTDPVDGSVSKNQGYIFKYADGSRFVFRKSGTGSSGATIRIYLEKYDAYNCDQDVSQALEQISDRALELCQIESLTGRKEPTVIT